MYDWCISETYLTYHWCMIGTWCMIDVEWMSGTKQVIYPIDNRYIQGTPRLPLRPGEGLPAAEVGIKKTWTVDLWKREFKRQKPMGWTSKNWDFTRFNQQKIWVKHDFSLKMGIHFELVRSESMANTFNDIRSWKMVWSKRNETNQQNADWSNNTNDHWVDRWITVNTYISKKSNDPNIVRSL